MPACELADVLVKIYDVWQAGDREGAREIHRRLLPLINLETHPFMRYILKRRGVSTSLEERTPPGALALDAADCREISTLLRAIENDINGFPFIGGE